MAERCGAQSPVESAPSISCDLPAGHDGPHEHHHPRVVITWDATTTTESEPA